MQRLEHSLKDVDVETLVYPSEEEDEVLEDVAAADGAVYVKEDLRLHSQGLAHSVSTVDNTDITHLNVRAMPARPEQAVPRRL